MAHGAGERRFAAAGMVVAIDSSRHSATISHGEIAGYMDAMVMPFRVLKAEQLGAVHPGDTVSFTLVVGNKSSWIENIRAVPFESAERDPSLAKRLALLDSVMSANKSGTLAIGAAVPDFTLTDQTGRAVSLSMFRGKVIALSFVYTRCPLPDYCFRLSNNLALLSKRFTSERDVILLTVTFDPVHDSPEVLANYARTWRADPKQWHFLTGSPAEVQRVCGLFGVEYWRDDGFLIHSLHTIVIGRDGKLRANIEGNRFSARQLGDLVAVALK